MKLSRRDFLKLSGASVGGALFAGKANLSSLFPHPPKTIRLKNKVSESTTICCFCGCGCGALVQKYEGGKIVVEGDPDHPVNEGALCSKGMALAQLNQVDGKPNSRRLNKVLYRAPGGTDWQEKEWDWAIDQIARKIKKTRDENWTEKDENGFLVNRTDAIANLGGASLDNEECYILSKLARALGIVYLEHQARI